MTVVKWTLETVRNEALKYDQRSKFKKGSGGAFSAARRNGWLEEVCAHMVYPKKRPGYWTFERALEFERVKNEALKYTTRIDFKKAPNSAYRVAIQKGWLEEVTSHMPKKVS